VEKAASKLLKLLAITTAYVGDDALRVKGIRIETFAEFRAELRKEGFLVKGGK